MLTMIGFNIDKNEAQMWPKGYDQDFVNKTKQRQNKNNENNPYCFEK